MSDWNGFRVVESKKKDEEVSDNKLAGDLKKVLANAYVLYHTIHGFHWNVKGTDFYEYHKLFDEIVDDIYDNIDPIAENIVKLGDVAPFVMSQLSSMASIKEVGLFSKDAKELTQKFREMNLEYIAQLKLTFDVANKQNEQGIANFIAERIDQHQKWDWFLKASLGE